MFLLRFSALMCALFIPYGVLSQMPPCRKLCAGDGGKVTRAHLDDA